MRKRNTNRTHLSATDKNKVFQQASTVLMYWSLPGEVPTHQFINDWDRRKYILLPVVKGDDLELKMYEGGGQYENWPLWHQRTHWPHLHRLRPHRLVRGAWSGFRPLQTSHGTWTRILRQTAGAHSGTENRYCVPQQIVEELPAEPWDVDMDIVMY